MRLFTYIAHSLFTFYARASAVFSEQHVVHRLKKNGRHFLSARNLPALGEPMLVPARRGEALVLILVFENLSVAYNPYVVKTGSFL